MDVNDQTMLQAVLLGRDITTQLDSDAGCSSENRSPRNVQSCLDPISCFIKVYGQKPR